MARLGSQIPFGDRSSRLNSGENVELIPMKGIFPDPDSADPLKGEQVATVIELLLDEGIASGAKKDFLRRLHRRGEAAQELALFAEAFLCRAVMPDLGTFRADEVVELCGTGGDRAGYLNVSTASMFVCAGAGARVVKHGNRAVSSKCGSADVLEELGVHLHLRPERVGEVLERAGCVFLLAVDYHPALGALSSLRRDMATEGHLTVFNLLGPLLNPARPGIQLAGIYRGTMLPVYAEAMRLMGRNKAWAVHGQGIGASAGGIDELSILAPSIVHEVFSTPEASRVFRITPGEAGLAMASDESSLAGGDARFNASRILSILDAREESAATDMILLNAGAALHLAGFGASLRDSVSLAEESLRTGRAMEALVTLRHASASAGIS